MDSKTKTPFQLFIFPEAMMLEVVFVTICLDFCAHFFFGVPHIILIFCDQCLKVQVATVHEFSCVFSVFSLRFLFPHLCSIVVLLNSVLDFFLFFSPFFLCFPHAPVFHCCAGGRDISCTVFAQSEIAKDSFCACLQFPQALIVFNFIPQNTLINGQDFFFSDYNSIAQHPNF